MKVILKKEIADLGQPGDIVEVKPGYARNYLVPGDFALQATPSNMKVYEHEKRQLDKQKSKDRAGAEHLAEQLKGVSLTATVAVGEEDKVFGSVTSQHIAELLKAKGFEIDRRKILLEEPLKALGVYEIPIKIHSDVVGQIKVWVVKE